MAKTVWKKAIASGKDTWYHKKEDQSVEGPLKLAELLSQTMQGNILPGHEVSEDNKNWRPVEELTELKMVWMVDSGDAESYGPVNILAIPNLVKRGIVPQTARLVNKSSWKIISVNEILKPTGSVRIAQKKDEDDTEPTDAPEANVTAKDEEAAPIAGPPKTEKQEIAPKPALEVVDDDEPAPDAKAKTKKKKQVSSGQAELPGTKKIPTDTDAKRAPEEKRNYEDEKRLRLQQHKELSRLVGQFAKDAQTAQRDLEAVRKDLEEQKQLLDSHKDAAKWKDLKVKQDEQDAPAPRAGASVKQHPSALEQNKDAISSRRERELFGQIEKLEKKIKEKDEALASVSQAPKRPIPDADSLKRMEDLEQKLKAEVERTAAAEKESADLKSHGEQLEKAGEQREKVSREQMHQLQEAMEQAQGRVEELNAELEARTQAEDLKEARAGKAAESEKVDAARQASETDSLRKELEVVRIQVQELESEKKALSDRYVKLETDYFEKSKTHTIHSQGVTKDLKIAIKQVDDLTRELDEARVAHSASKKEFENEEQTHAELVEKADEAASQIRTELEQAQTDLKDRENDVAEARKALEKSNPQIDALKQECGERGDRVAQLEKELAAEKEAHETTQQSVSGKESEREEKLKAAQSEQETLRGRIAKLEESNQAAEQKRQEEAARAKEELSEVQERLQQVTMELEVEKSSYERAKSAAENSETTLQKQLEDAQAEASEAASKLGKIRDTIDKQQKKVAEKEEKSASSVAELNKKVKALRSDISERDTELRTLRSYFEEQQSEFNTLKDKSQKAKAELQAAVETLTSERDRTQKAETELRTSVVDLTNELAASAGSLEAVTEQIEMRAESKDAPPAAQKPLVREQKLLEEEIAKLKIEVEKTAGDLDKSAAALESSQYETDTLKKTCEELEKNEKGAQDELVTKDDELLEAATALTAAKHDVEELRQERDELREKKEEPQVDKEYFLRLEDDDTIYGPMQAAVLRDWAAQCRISPGDEISADKQSWMPAESLPDLKMDWMVELVDGSQYGPLNVLAIHDLLADGAVAANASAFHQKTKVTLSVDKLPTMEMAAAYDALGKGKLDGLGGEESGEKDGGNWQEKFEEAQSQVKKLESKVAMLQDQLKRRKKPAFGMPSAPSAAAAKKPPAPLPPRIVELFANRKPKADA